MAWYQQKLWPLVEGHGLAHGNLTKGSQGIKYPNFSLVFAGTLPIDSAQLKAREQESSQMLSLQFHTYTPSPPQGRWRVNLEGAKRRSLAFCLTSAYLNPLWVLFLPFSHCVQVLSLVTDSFHPKYSSLEHFLRLFTLSLLVLSETSALSFAGLVLRFSWETKTKTKKQLHRVLGPSQLTICIPLLQCKDSCKLYTIY